jgi:hypothetical protein
MRQILPFKKLTAFFIALLSLLYACNFFDDKRRPAKIRIKKGDATSGTLDLKDRWGFSAKHFKVKAGRTLQWLQQAKEVKTITNIYAKDPNGENVFSVLPHLIPGTSDWEGTIDPSAAYKEEEYNIDWTDTAGHPQTFDPYIQVKPQ